MGQHRFTGYRKLLFGNLAVIVLKSGFQLYTFSSEGGSGNCVDKNFTFNMVTPNGNKMFQELSQCQLLTLGLSTIAFTAIFGGLKRLGLFYQWRHKVGKIKIKSLKKHLRLRFTLKIYQVE